MGVDLFEPIPGDPAAISGAARRLASAAAAVGTSADRLANVPSGLGPHAWGGRASERFTEVVGQLAAGQRRSGHGLLEASHALSAFAVVLEESQQDLRRAQLMRDDSLRYAAPAAAAGLASTQLVDPVLSAAQTLAMDAWARYRQAAARLANALEASAHEGVAVRHGLPSLSGSVPLAPAAAGALAGLALLGAARAATGTTVVTLRRERVGWDLGDQPAFTTSWLRAVPPRPLRSIESLGRAIRSVAREAFSVGNPLPAVAAAVATEPAARGGLSLAVIDL
ncbi:MAG TPA: hypothetical protein VMU75_10315 [Acidimicrobiales bacterium]|nr:hypothetical protein [Acidimicrobiales bacterium]